MHFKIIIKESVKKTAIYDLTPLTVKHIKYRERDEGKEVGPIFHFKPRTDNERLIEKGIIPSPTNKSMYIYIISNSKRNNRNSKSGLEINKRSNSKRSSSTCKTYYKGIESIFSNSKGFNKFFYCIYLLGVKGSFDGIQIGNNIEEKEYLALAKDILKKCNIIRPTRCRTAMLRERNSKFYKTHYKNEEMKKKQMINNFYES